MAKASRQQVNPQKLTSPQLMPKPAAGRVKSKAGSRSLNVNPPRFANSIAARVGDAPLQTAANDDVT
jgi:hypothetical protein